VVGYDGSRGADAAAAFGLWLSGRLPCAVRLAHVCPAAEPAPAPDLLVGAADQTVAYTAEWQRRLQNLRVYAPPGADISAQLLHGGAAGALIDFASQTAADLILVGSHGIGPLRGALLGSVSSQLLSHAPCSVMIFRENGALEPASHARSVVVGIDGSPASRRALEFAATIAVALAAELVLLHAYDPHAPFVTEPSRALREMSRAHARAIVAEARAGLAAPLDVVGEEIVEGHPRDELIAACERHVPAVLVVGSRGLGGFKDLLLGSTSRWVANCAPCPVVVTRPAEHAIRTEVAP
jgi:nucleotide-binding universal stress UspA family protein